MARRNDNETEVPMYCQQKIQMAHRSSFSVVTERVLRVRLPAMPLLCRGGLGARRCADPGRTRGERGGVPAQMWTDICTSCGLAHLL